MGNAQNQITEKKLAEMLPLDLEQKTKILDSSKLLFTTLLFHLLIRGQVSIILVPIVHP